MATVFLTFIELVMDNGWVEMQPPFEQPLLQQQNLAGYRVYVTYQGSEIRLVEPEVVIRRFQFRAGTILYVRDSVVIFEGGDIQNELSVDEDLREGKRLKLA